MRKRNNWREHAAAQERSGKSINRYCRDLGLDPKRLYYWRRQVGKGEVAKGEESCGGTNRFVRVGGSETVEVQTTDGLLIKTSIRELRQVLEALR